MSGPIVVVVKGDTSQFQEALKKSGDDLDKFGGQAKIAGDTTGKAFDFGTQSAKQLAFNLRGIPMQFTDIFVSLQSGQAPLTVLLQQGGQLKDMFGGIIPAAKALGGYVLGLVNPYTLVAAAVGTLGYAYMKGAAEGEAYTKAIVLSGNAAGVTSGQLAGMAQNVAKASGGTIGSAAEALALLAGNGNIAAAQFEKITAVAVGMQKTTGVAVADTVKQFAELAKDPVGASLKLTATTNYLTAAVYEQIKSLTDQGKTLEAGAVAVGAYHDAMASRIPALVDNAGLLEKAWKGVWGAIKGAGDALAGIGRPDTPKEAEDALRKAIAVREGFIKNFATGNIDQTDKPLIALKKELETLQRMAASKGSMAVYDADRIKRDEASIALSERADKFAGKKLLMEREIAQVQTQYNNSNKTASDLANQDKALAGIKKKYEEIAKTQGSGNSDALKEQTERMNLGRKAAMAMGDEVTRANDAYAKSLEVIVKADLAAAAAHDKYVQSLASGLGKLQQEVAAQKEINDRLGLSKEAIAALDAAKLESQAVTLDLLAIKTLDKNLDEVQYNLYKAQAEELRKLAVLKGQGAAKGVAVDEAKKAADAATAAEAAWTKTAESIENSLTDALMRGFENGKGFIKNLRDTIVNMFKTMVLRPIISAVMNPISQGMAGMVGTMGTAAAGGVAGTAGSGMLGSLGGSAMFASLSASMSTMGTAALATTQSLMGLTGASGSLTAAQISTLSATTTGAGSIAASIGTAIPYVAIALAVYSLLKGGGKKQTGAGVTGKFSSTGMDANQYVEMTNKPGMLRRWLGANDNVYNNLSPLDSATQLALQTGFKLVQASALGAASALGLSATSIKDYSKEFTLALTGDAAKDQAATVALFAGMSDDMAQALLGSYRDEFAKEGEKASATLQRLAVSIGAVNTRFADFGYNLIEVGLSGASTASKLIDAFGGLEAFAASTASYYQNFYTEAERTMRLTTLTSEAFAKLGIVMPVMTDSARAWYRAEVERLQAMDMGVEANRIAFASIMSLNGAVSTLAQAATEAVAAVDAARSNLTAAYERESSALQTTIDKFAGFSKSLLAFRDLLFVGSLSTLSPEAKYSAAKDRFAQTSALAMAGDEGARGELQGVSQQFLESSRDYNASSAAYASDFRDVQSAVRLSASSALTLAGVAQAQLTAVQASVSGLMVPNNSVPSVRDAIAALHGATAGKASAEAAIAATAAAAEARTIAATAAEAAAAEARTIAATAAEAAASARSVAAVAAFTAVGIKIRAEAAAAAAAAPEDYVYSSVANIYIKVARPLMAEDTEATVLNRFATGSNYIPYDMTARIHKGEEIKPARFVDIDRKDREATNKLLAEVLMELRADKTQRAAVSDATLEKLDAVIDHAAATKRELARA